MWLNQFKNGDIINLKAYTLNSATVAISCLSISHSNLKSQIQYT